MSRFNLKLRQCIVWNGHHYLTTDALIHDALADEIHRDLVANFPGLSHQLRKAIAAYIAKSIQRYDKYYKHVSVKVEQAYKQVREHERDSS